MVNLDKKLELNLWILQEKFQAVSCSILSRSVSRWLNDCVDPVALSVCHVPILQERAARAGGRHHHSKIYCANLGSCNVPPGFLNRNILELRNKPDKSVDVCRKIGCPSTSNERSLETSCFQQISIFSLLQRTSYFGESPPEIRKRHDTKKMMWAHHDRRLRSDLEAPSTAWQT